MKTIRLIIKGKVQGVFFRATAKEQADSLGINGQVRNLPDRNVEIIASGTEDQIEQMIAWCRVGPDRAVVEDVIIEELHLENFRGFRIVR